MELHAIGTGSAFTYRNWQSNFLIRQNGKHLLIDCGGDVRHGMFQEFGLTSADIDAVYISHLHNDHIGGCEWVGFTTLFNPMLDKPKLYAEANVMHDLWDVALKGGMEGLEGHKYTGEREFVDLSVYFDMNPISRNGHFVWEGIRFDIVQTLHITAKYSHCHSYGLMWNDPDTGERIYITTDAQFSPESSMLAFYNECDVVYQDCETTDFKTGVHANYIDLCNLPPEVKAKMWLYHYQDNVLDSWDEWNAKAKADGFLGFIPTAARFSRSYTEYEAGSVGNLFNRVSTNIGMDNLGMLFSAIEDVGGIKEALKILKVENT
jgi:ribonuclease BN (tRNA processing enzyme)